MSSFLIHVFWHLYITYKFYIHTYIYIYTYICMYICIDHENNVFSRSSSQQWHCGNPCTWTWRTTIMLSMVHHVPRYMSCRKTIVVITKEGFVFKISYIILILPLQGLSTLSIMDRALPVQNKDLIKNLGWIYKYLKWGSRSTDLNNIQYSVIIRSSLWYHQHQNDTSPDLNPYGQYSFKKGGLFL